MGKTILKVEDLYYVYGNGKPALNGINVDIREGEKIAVIGSNGSGKSTFFLNINGVFTPEHGKIIYRDAVVNKKNLKELRKNFEQWHTQTFSHEFLISDRCRLPGFLKQMLKNGEIQLYNGKSFEYGYLRSKGCDIPEYLKQMLFDIDDNKEAVFNSLKHLPVVLCHRDFWVENIFLSDGKIRLIDWDCTGFGYLGEDIASLIYDDTETENLHEYFRRLISAYIKGISEYLEIPQDFNKYIQEIILIVFGYRMVQNHMFTESTKVKEEQVKRLQKIYEMRDM